MTHYADLLRAHLHECMLCRSELLDPETLAREIQQFEHASNYEPLTAGEIRGAVYYAEESFSHAMAENASLREPDEHCTAEDIAADVRKWEAMHPAVRRQGAIMSALKPLYNF